MEIEGFTYNVKTELRFRFPLWKVTVLIAALTLMALGAAHADPTTWNHWSPGGGSRAMPD